MTEVLVGDRRIIAAGDLPPALRPVESLETLVQSRLVYDPYPRLAEGMAVEVVRGPLTGVRGILLRRERRCRLVIAVDVIRQGAAVAIDAADVVPV
jgi:hypothetical protein